MKVKRIFVILTLALLGAAAAGVLLRNRLAAFFIESWAAENSVQILKKIEPQVSLRSARLNRADILWKGLGVHAKNLQLTYLLSGRFISKLEADYLRLECIAPEIKALLGEALPLLRLGKVECKFEAENFEYFEPALRAKVLQHSFVTLSNLHLEPISAEKIIVSLPEALEVEFKTEGNEIQHDGKIAFEVTAATAGPVTLHAANGQLVASSSSESATVAATLSADTKIEFRGLELPADRLKTDIVSSLKNRSSKVNFTYQRESLAGVLEVDELQRSFSLSLRPLLAPHFWGMLLQKFTGTLLGGQRVDGLVSWQQGGKENFSVEITSKNGELSSEAVTLKGVDSSLIMSGKSHHEISTKAPATFTAGNMEAPIELSGINLRYIASFNMNPSPTGEITLLKGHAQFAGHSITAHDCTLRLPPLEGRCLISAEDLELGSLFALYPQTYIRGKGRLSFTAPIKFTRGLAAIESGKVFALGPGSIRFTPPKEAIESANQAMQFAYRALENYQYDSLKGSFKYDRGKLLLQVSMSGWNTAIVKDRPVNLNLSIEEDIPALLASLSAVRKAGTSVNTGAR
ncbi:MAG: YdbH domain-containing protein [Deltaproteobacteria bacterium]|nr:YdbH domain-containing protein [Deltaproteobacteria bacterium]